MKEFSYTGYRGGVKRDNRDAGRPKFNQSAPQAH
ncbi:MAG: hypothetical protein QOI53_3147 [Verrucomicrobiota bacterium]|jgi:hypothetical protein|nr:hypothetical protein [Verrucomicrobiota bacterium]